MQTRGPGALSAPIGILDEHPEWSSRLIAELQNRRLPVEKMDHSNHAYHPGERQPRYSVIVNRTSPSSHRRGHGSVLFYAEPLLQHYESLGIPVVNPVAAYRFEKSKALQIGLFERLNVPYPRTIVLNHRDQVLKAIDGLRFPLLFKPNVGGSGAGIERFDGRADLEVRLPALDFGPDAVGLLQEYIEPGDDAIVRVEILAGRLLYAIRVVRTAMSSFNLCPADLCEGPAPAATVGACPAAAGAVLDVTRCEPPREVVEQAIALARAAAIDVGGIEYLVSREDRLVYFYDINATSNVVANAPAVLGFDPFPSLVDHIVSVGREGKRPAA